MSEQSEEAEVVPVKKEGQHTAPRHLLSPFEEMEKMFESFFPRSLLRGYRLGRPVTSDLSAPFEGQMPKVDIIDREDEIYLRAELPGVNKNDISISMTDHTFTIKGDYYRCVTSSGSYTRTLSLPADVDTDKAKAELKDGVLELSLPKMEGAKRRTIEVK